MPLLSSCTLQLWRGGALQPNARLTRLASRTFTWQHGDGNDALGAAAHLCNECDDNAKRADLRPAATALGHIMPASRGMATLNTAFTYVKRTTDEIFARVHTHTDRRYAFMCMQLVCWPRAGMTQCRSNAPIHVSCRPPCGIFWSSVCWVAC